MNQPLVLMVDDNRGELDMGESAFAELGIAVRFVGLHRPETAVERLHAIAADAHATLPALVLLDLNMPRIPGLQILALLKGDPRLRRIPVVVLTTSGADLDRSRCLALGADEYQVKPHRLDAYLALFGSFRRYVAGDGGPDGGQGSGPGVGGDPGPTATPPSGAPRLGRWRLLPGLSVLARVLTVVRQNRVSQST